MVGWETGTNQSVSHPTIIPGPQKLNHLCSILLIKEADLISGLSTKVTISKCKIVNCKNLNFNITKILENKCKNLISKEQLTKINVRERLQYWLLLILYLLCRLLLWASILVLKKITIIYWVLSVSSTSISSLHINSFNPINNPTRNVTDSIL